MSRILVLEEISGILVRTGFLELDESLYILKGVTIKHRLNLYSMIAASVFHALKCGTVLRNQKRSFTNVIRSMR
jgi:hypothetical protein